jgi:hypothetical protein
LTISLPGIPREHLSQMAPASPAYRWSLVAVLAWAGFISGVYTTIIIRIMSYGTANQYPFTFFGSLCFGLAMCSVLWAFGFVSSGRAGVTLVAATIAVHLIDVFVTEKNILRWVMVEHSLVALALYSTFLLVLVRGRRKLWTLLVAPACAALTVVVVYYIVRVADSFVVTPAMLDFPTQTTHAGFLAVALALAGVDRGTPRRRFTLVYVQLGYFVAVFAGVYLFIQLPMEAKVAREKEEIATRLANAPSRVNLPALNEGRIDRVLLMEGVGEWRLSESYSGRLPAEQTGGDTFAPRPERVSYYANYGPPSKTLDDFRAITVSVIQYPNAAWAKFDVLNSTGRVGIPRLSRFGQTFYQDGPYFSWSSGDRRILLDCQSTPPEVIDEFLKAYLAKYPSSQ